MVLALVFTALFVLSCTEPNFNNPFDPDNQKGTQISSSSSEITTSFFCYYPSTQQCFDVGSVTTCPGGGELRSSCPSVVQSSSSSSDIYVSSSSEITVSSTSSEEPSSSSSIIAPSSSSLVPSSSSVAPSSSSSDWWEESSSSNEVEGNSSSSFIVISSSSLSEESSSSSESSNSTESSSSTVALSSSSSGTQSSSSVLNSSSSSTKCGNRTEEYDTEMYECVQDGEYYKIYIKDDYKPQDGNSRKYKAVLIGTQTWMAENMNYINENIRGLCYDAANSSINNDNCSTYGRLYNWSMAMDLSSSSNCNSDNCPHKGICPNGWHIPSVNEWITLAAFVGGTGANNLIGVGRILKVTDGWDDCRPSCNGYDIYGLDKYGFAALPGGSYINNGGYGSIGKSGMWWSTTESSKGANLFSMNYTNDDAGISGFDKNIFLSVRCVMD